MIKRWRWGSYRFSVSASKVVDVKGFNSILSDKHHILLWDFDNSSKRDVALALMNVQSQYGLPEIRVSNSGKSRHWVACCFKRLRFREALQILASTPGIDVSFLKYGIYRGHWTLRITPKNQRRIKFAFRLGSNVPPDVSPYELKSFVHYESTSVS